MELKAELSPPSGGGQDSVEVARAERSRQEGANGPSKQGNLRRLFQDDVFERAARRPLVALG